jgi:hypothetical protein
MKLGTPASSFLARVLFALTLCVALSSCTQFSRISGYDEATDKALSALQQSCDDFITKLIVTAPSQQNAFKLHTSFYDSMDEQLRRLEFRVGSIPQNERTVKLVADVRTVILGSGNCSNDGSSLRDLHCRADAAATGPSAGALRIAQRNINQTIAAALSLEMAKKYSLQADK